MAVAEVFGIGAVFWFKDLASTQIRKAGAEVDKLQVKLAGMKEYSIAQSAAITTMASGIMPVVAGLATFAAPALFAAGVAKLDEQIFMTGKTANATAEEMAQLKAAVYDIAANRKFSHMDVAKGLYEVTSAGYDVNSAVTLMQGAVSKFAIVSGQSLGETADMLTGAMLAFNVPAKDAIGLTDRMIELQNRTKFHYAELTNLIAKVSGPAKGLNQSFSSALAWAGMFRNVGLTAREATLRTVSLYRALTQRRTVDFANEIGVKMFDQSGKMRDVTDVLLDFDKAMTKVGLNDAGKQMAATYIFGQRNMDIFNKLRTMEFRKIEGGISTLYKGPEAVKEMAKDIDKSSKGLTDAVSKQQMELLINQFALLKNTVAGTFKEIGDVATPQTLELVKNWISMAEAAGLWVKKNPDTVRSILQLSATVGKLLLLFGTMKIAWGAFKMIAAIPIGLRAQLSGLGMQMGAFNNSLRAVGASVSATSYAVKDAATSQLVMGSAAEANAASLRNVRLGLAGVKGSIQSMMGVALPGILQTAAYAGLSIAIGALVQQWMNWRMEVEQTNKALKEVEDNLKRQAESAKKKYGVEMDPLELAAVKNALASVKTLPAEATSEEKSAAFAEGYRNYIVNVANEKYLDKYGSGVGYEAEKQKFVQTYMDMLATQPDEIAKAIQKMPLAITLKLDGKVIYDEIQKADSEEKVRTGKAVNKETARQHEAATLGHGGSVIGWR